MKYQYDEPADRKAKRIRQAVAQFYERDPERAVVHVNALLSEASRQEENRQNLLELEVI